MGLDIYIKKVKRTRKNADAIANSDWEKVNESSIEQDTVKLVKAYKLLSERLKCVDSDAYAEEYKNGVCKFFKFFNYPSFDLCDIGVKLDYSSGKYCITPVSLDVFEKSLDGILKHYYGHHVGYFRKVNCVYRYFQDRLTDETAWVSKGDCEDIVKRCNDVLKNPNFAMTLLPTQSGFFFGSTEYDKYYYDDLKNVRKQFKSFIKYFKTDDDFLYIHMSW